MPGHGALLKPSVQLSGVFDCELDLGPSSGSKEISIDQLRLCEPSSLNKL